MNAEALRIQKDMLRKIETLRGNLMDVHNIVELLGMSLAENQEDEHIVRSVNIIDKMISSILQNDIKTLKLELGGKESE